MDGIMFPALIVIASAFVFFMTVKVLRRKSAEKKAHQLAERQSLFNQFIALREVKDSSYWDFWNQADEDMKRHVVEAFWNGMRAGKPFPKNQEKNEIYQFFFRNFHEHAMEVAKSQYTMSAIDMAPSAKSYARYFLNLEKAQEKVVRQDAIKAKLRKKVEERQKADRKVRNDFYSTLPADDVKKFKSLRTRASRAAFIEEKNGTSISNQALILILLGEETSRQVSSGSGHNSYSSSDSYDSGNNSHPYSSHSSSYDSGSSSSYDGGSSSSSSSDSGSF